MPLLSYIIIFARLGLRGQTTTSAPGDNATPTKLDEKLRGKHSILFKEKNYSPKMIEYLQLKLLISN